jgi:hypothetical protein
MPKNSETHADFVVGLIEAHWACKREFTAKLDVEPF